MAYKINKTNGALLVDLIDGTVDTNSTSLTLVGRNYSNNGCRRLVDGQCK